MLLSAVPGLVIAQPSSKVPEGLMNYPVHMRGPNVSQARRLRFWVSLFYDQNQTQPNTPQNVNVQVQCDYCHRKLI
jgi:hypothetical protein